MAGVISSFIGRRNEFTPEEKPIVIDKDLTSDGFFTFVDIIPGQFKPHEYHTFRELMDEANVWLEQNMEWEVINCETVLLFFKPGSDGTMNLAPEDTCFPLDGDTHQSLMGLRLWLSQSGKKIFQKLQYVDFCPRHEDEDDHSRFRRLDAVMERANKEIQSGKTDLHMGPIITLESLYYPVQNSDWKIEGTNSLHLFPSRCVCILRLFYTRQQEPVFIFPLIGVQDFVPNQITTGGFFKMPTFEPFTEVFARASDWLSHHPENQFLNAQCLEVKVKGSHKVDTQVMNHSGDRGDYARIVRLAFTKDTDPNRTKEPPPAPLFLSSIIFTPGDQEASVAEIKRRLEDWVQQAMSQGSPPLGEAAMYHNEFRPRLMSAETVEIFCKDFSEEEIRGETENTFKPNRIGTMNQFLFMAFRVYFDVGFYGRNARRGSIPVSSGMSGKAQSASCSTM